MESAKPQENWGHSHAEGAARAGVEAGAAGPPSPSLPLQRGKVLGDPRDRVTAVNEAQTPGYILEADVTVLAGGPLQGGQAMRWSPRSGLRAPLPREKSGSLRRGPQPTTRGLPTDSSPWLGRDTGSEAVVFC